MNATVAPGARTLAAQDAVVAHGGGPLLVLGGPGTGKTTALERRYLRLAGEPGLAPHRILFLCGNRRYSMEAKERLFAALERDAVVDVPVYTWHALAYHLVSRHYPALGYREPPVLLTGPEQWGKVSELLRAEAPLRWGVWADRLRDRAFVDEVADFCLRVTQRLMPPEDLAALARQRPEWEPVTRFYGVYTEELRKDSRLDYAGLIAAAVGMLSGDPSLRETLRRRFPHVLVDEGEEMSPAQQKLLGLLELGNLVVAADPDSGIEGFRGGEPEWVFGFGRFIDERPDRPAPRDATSAIVLDDGRRIGAPLAGAAARLADANDPGGGRTFTAPAPHPTTFEARQFASPSEEVDHIARELRRLHLFEGVAWDDMAVLVSQPAYLLGSLQRALARWEVPHRPLVGERPLGAEPAIAPFLDLVRVVRQVEDWEGLLPGLLTSPLIGLGYAERRRLERAAWQSGRSLWKVMEDSDALPEIATFFRLRDLVEQHAGEAQECFWEVFNAAPYYQALREAATGGRDRSGEASLQLDAVVAFHHALGRFVERRHGVATIDDYLNEAARADFGGDPWLPPVPSGSGRVAIQSFHAAKGREWDTVVVAGCLDAWIPKGRRAQGLFDPYALEIPEAADREVEAIAADRRTFFVAATRARRRVLFTVSGGPSGRGRYSRFLDELGCVPVAPPAEELPALTASEQRARLRRILETDPGPEAQVAALLALAELPGTDPGSWYGRWAWTEGAVPVAGDVLSTSYSRLSYYDNCGLQYVLVSVLGLDPASTHSMKFGTWMHALFEAVHKDELTTPSALLERYRTYFDESVFPNRTIARQFRRDGERMLRVFWENERRYKTVEVEHFFELHYGSTALLRGRIDRIDQIGDSKLRLTDYKTAKWAAGVQEAQESLQLAIYYMAAREDPGLAAYGTPIAARLMYPGATYPDGKPMERVQNPEQADKVLERLPGLIEGIREERFAPSPMADCMWCAVKALCPLWPQGSELT